MAAHASVLSLAAVLLALSTSGILCKDNDVEKSKYCTNESLMACVYPMNADHFTFISKKEDLDVFCPDLHKGLRCIDDYTRRCLEPAKRSHFNKLYSTTTMVFQEICHEGAFQDEYLRHAPCLKEIKENYELCAKEYQEKFKEISSTNVSEAKLCCSLHAYLTCSKDLVSRTCGKETALFAAGFLDKMAYPLMEGHCEKYSTGSEPCLVYNSSYSLRVPTISLILGIFLYFLHS